MGCEDRLINELFHKKVTTVQRQLTLANVGYIWTDIYGERQGSNTSAT